jgi:heptaprenylglyceryl phosphate synthase
MDGINSLLNENKFSYTRGDKIKYLDKFHKLQQGTYVMASSAEGYIVLDIGHGVPKVVHIDNVIK